MATGSESKSNGGSKPTRIRSITDALKRARKIAAYSQTMDVPF